MPGEILKWTVHHSGDFLVQRQLTKDFRDVLLCMIPTKVNYPDPHSLNGLQGVGSIGALRVAWAYLCLLWLDGRSRPGIFIFPRLHSSCDRLLPLVTQHPRAIVCAKTLSVSNTVNDFILGGVWRMGEDYLSFIFSREWVLCLLT